MSYISREEVDDIGTEPFSSRGYGEEGEPLLLLSPPLACLPRTLCLIGYPTPSAKAYVLGADGDLGRVRSPSLGTQRHLPLCNVLGQESNMMPGSPEKACTVALSSDFQAPPVLLIRAW